MGLQHPENCKRKCLSTDILEPDNCLQNFSIEPDTYYNELVVMLS